MLWLCLVLPVVVPVVTSYISVYILKFYYAGSNSMIFVIYPMCILWFMMNMLYCIMGIYSMMEPTLLFYLLIREARNHKKVIFTAMSKFSNKNGSSTSGLAIGIPVWHAQLLKSRLFEVIESVCYVDGWREGKTERRSDFFWKIVNTALACTRTSYSL